jgi:hypothetical protein
MRPGEKIETIRVHKAIAEMTREDLWNVGKSQ